MTGRNYELSDDITTLGVMVIFELINWDNRGARPRGFHIPKLSQVRVLTRFYALVPLLPYLNLQVSSVFVFVVLSSQYCNIWNPNPRLTVTDRDERASADSTSRSVTGNGIDRELGWWCPRSGEDDIRAGSSLACRWRVLRGCSPHCRRAGGV